MSRHAFPTSPSATGEQRKFVNPTSGFVGANIFGPDGKPTAVPVEPGGEVWLTPEEERMTAEAPRNAADNPFIREWQEAVEFDTFGEPTRFITRQGILVLSDDPPRPVASDRFIPDREPVAERSVEDTPDEPETEEEIKGADVPTPEQPAPQGQPSPDEIVGTPDAVAANDEALAERSSTREQPTRRRSAGVPT